MSGVTRQGSDSGLTILKFGGSSVADAEAMDRVVAIVQAHAERGPVVVVVSAIARATRELVVAASAVRRRRGKVSDVARRIVERHRGIAARFPDDDVAGPRLEESLQRLERELCEALVAGAEDSNAARARDLVASFGELLSSTLLSERLLLAGVPAVLTDARSMVITDDRFGSALPRPKELETRIPSVLGPILAEGGVPVVQGYIGATSEGVPTTMGFEASDYSATLVGAALRAREVIIWTDVPGVLTADNRLIPDARPVPELAVAEASELALLGAKVLHPRTLEPAAQRGIPVRVKSSLEHDEPGTLIGVGADPAPGPKSVVLLVGGVPPEVDTEHAWAPKPGSALLSVVGLGVASDPELVRTIRALAGEGTVCFGPGDLSVRIVVGQEGGVPLLRVLHDKLFRRQSRRRAG